eukprot:scaffold310935_cov17-Tisochrysis_lutea.AAC.1
MLAFAALTGDLDATAATAAADATLLAWDALPPNPPPRRRHLMLTWEVKERGDGIDIGRRD